MKAGWRPWLGGSIVLLALSGAQARAAVTPNPLFTEGAVLQQGMPVPIWGTAREGEKVTVSFQGQNVTTTTQDGKWKVRLKPLKAGGPYPLTIQGDNRVELKAVLVGEVFLCSGQSNMEFALSNSVSGAEAIAQSGDPMLHLFIVAHHIADAPETEANGKWAVSGPTTTPRFSAVAYFFGRKLRQELNVPVGLIESAWGGTPAEAWTSREALMANEDLSSLVTAHEQAKERYAAGAKQFQTILDQYKQEAEQAKADGKEPPKPPIPPVNPANQNAPAALYNGMIAPLIPYAIRGAIWYQGESNAGRAYQYLTLFPAMIRNWRAAWGESDFPFFFVQLAPFYPIETEPKESRWAELREAQRQTALTVPKTGMAVITEFGNEKDIHPRRKQPVGERLALAALATVYGKKIEYSGPTLASQKIDGSRIVLTFTHAEGGLVAQDGALKGFAIAGEDGKWVNAEATIQGDTVIVSSPEVPHPIAARFGWANYPVTNLFNKAGLPASPFRTDDFPFVTRPH